MSLDTKADAYAVHWFRRDLRVAGNPALSRLRDEHQGRVLGVFCFDKAFLARPDFSLARFQFFIDTLKSLKNELTALGSDLMFCDIGPDEAFNTLFRELKGAGKPLPESIAWNRDYEPYAIDRDQRLQKWFHEQGVHTMSERDHILIEPHEIVKGTKPAGPYQIFTPYSRKWLEQFQTSAVQARIDEQKRGLAYVRKLRKGPVEPSFALTWAKIFGREANGWSVFEEYSAQNLKNVTIPIPPAGSLAALAQLETFKKHIDDFADARDIPSLEGTSRFSPFFKNGSLTTGQALAFFDLHRKEKLTKGEAKFLTELIWREFGYYILSKHPRVEREAFDERFRSLEWGNREDWFEAWKTGKTGYPIIDAGMRQLNETGWMHNRVRMIVASFLTKDLHINWQWGEKYFMEKLIDGDLALNNMGWQWAASTGCDAQPYFRIFNPALQSKKFDPEAKYIKQFVPELAQVAPKKIHLLDAQSRPRGYPAPIVDHDVERHVALKLYKVKAKREE
ncbi:MAG: deoxyribodipyrimidine photo-lyase [Chitinophagaceae bacterium]|nr:deoxyribodipyrimidine photo-lyase [Oligoflexus sp.]